MKAFDDRIEDREGICYVTQNLADAEAVARQLDGRIEAREREVKSAGGRTPAVKREFIVRSDARGWPESDFSSDRASR